jgi:hypothetical protein
MKHASAPPRSNGQRLELVAGTSPRELHYHCADKAGNISSAPLSICRVLLLLLQQRRGAAGSGLGTTIKYLRRKGRLACGINIFNLYLESY